MFGESNTKQYGSANKNALPSRVVCKDRDDRLKLLRHDSIRLRYPLIVKRPPKVKDQYARMFGAILDVLRDAGGKAAAREVMIKVADIVVTNPEERNEVHKSGVNKPENEVAFARNDLADLGLIDRTLRGVWVLTAEGWAAKPSLEHAREMLKTSRSNRPRSKPKQEVDGISTIDIENNSEFLLDNSEVLQEIQEQDEILNVVYALTPKGFERFSERLLTELGFTQLEVTGKPNDGGIDGEGQLTLNPLLSIKLYFQCKRYLGAVGPDAIRSFRGALEGRADYGIFLTTGSFTKEARKEALRAGTKPIELVDGMRIVELIQRFQLGVKPRTVYDVDSEWFKQFDSF